MAEQNRQVAFITGSSRGIGRGIALALARAGFDIALNARTDTAELEATALDVADLGVKVTRVVGDVSRLSAHESMLDAVENALGPLTTLVNNAGVSVLNRGDLLDVTEASFDHCLNINAKAVFFLSQAFARRLLSRELASDLEYSLVNISSSNAVAASVVRGEYCVSKTAASMTSKLFAARLAEEGISVFDVQPGLIETDMSRPAKQLYQRRIDEEGLTLIRRLGQPDDIGRIVRTLVTGGLPYTAGQAISADAGLLLPRF